MNIQYTKDYSKQSASQILTHMNAIVLCAGFGSRLRPLTFALSKTVVPILGLPLAFHAIKQLLDSGIETVHCNTHILADGVESELTTALLQSGYGKNRLRFWREPTLLNTGGGIANILSNLKAEGGIKGEGDFIVVSGDIIGEIPLHSMVNRWALRQSNDAALMVTLPFDSARKDATWVSGETGLVVGFGDPATAPQGLQMRLFSNYQILSRELLETKSNFDETSIDLFYRKALNQNQLIIQLDQFSHLPWHNVGTYEEYSSANQINGSLISTDLECLIIDPDFLHDFDTKIREKGAVNPLSNTLVPRCKATIPKETLSLSMLQGTLETSLAEPLSKALQLLVQHFQPIILDPSLNHPRQETLLSPLRNQGTNLICLGAYSSQTWNSSLPLLIPLETLLHIQNQETLNQSNISQYSISKSQTYLLIIPDHPKNSPLPNAHHQFPQRC